LEEQMSRRGGFTLIELVLVMLLVALVSALAAPSLHSFIVGRQNSNAVSRVLALGGYARTKAISTGDVYRLNVDVRARTYWLSKKQNADYVQLREEFGRLFTLPEGMTAQWLPPGAHDFIDFYPDGRVDAGKLELVEITREAVQIGCRSEIEPLVILLQETR
jgi:prepilin-type N-terminal cleavage/methylation domain-containing protein